jgi:hypothetical protein
MSERPMPGAVGYFWVVNASAIESCAIKRTVITYGV